ncbi:hypothetical protein LINGRAHAP2_LOCUS7310 [Linum grandiflorum]
MPGPIKRNMESTSHLLFARSTDRVISRDMLCFGMFAFDGLFIEF